MWGLVSTQLSANVFHFGCEMNIVVANALGLDYPLVGVGSRSLKTKLLGAATGGLISVGNRIPVIKALRGVTFTLKEGDRLGLVGHNGAGKSTLLKVLAGIYQPTSGSVAVQGKVVATLNMSLGMELDATGIENIITRGLLLGMTRSEIMTKLDDIAEFTQLGDYLKMPVRIYSSGMATRLAFGTVTSMESDVLLMDEVIGTGDAAFMESAEKRLSQFMNRSKVIVLASHSETVIRDFCKAALLLERGEVVAMGPVDEILHIYRERSSSSTQS